MTWEEDYQICRETQGRRGGEAFWRTSEARKRVSQNTPEDWTWLRDSLRHPDRKWFVALVFKFQRVPKRLLAPMLQAGVHERNPSLNEVFIVPCVRSFGTASVCAALLSYLETGSNAEKAGAANAFYWTWGRKSDEDLEVLRGRIRAALLREFVQNEDLRVRQSIIPGLSLTPEDYPEDLRPLVPRAIEIARAHASAYIRHRVEVQLGAGGPYMAIPDTEPDR